MKKLLGMACRWLQVYTRERMTKHRCHLMWRSCRRHQIRNLWKRSIGKIIKAFRNAKKKNKKREGQWKTRTRARNRRTRAALLTLALPIAEHPNRRVRYRIYKSQCTPIGRGRIMLPSDFIPIQVIPDHPSHTVPPTPHAYAPLLGARNSWQSPVVPIVRHE